jgi:hypothetical protein
MRFATLVLASAAVGLCGLVHAQPSSVNFTLTQAPALSDDATAPPGQTTVGRWTGGSSVARSSTALASGEATSDIAYSRPVTNFRSEGFGNAVASSRDALSGDRILANAQVHPTRLSATVDLSQAELADSGDAHAWWQRSFSLAPHSSITLSGIGSFELGGSLMPAGASVDPFDRECEPYRYGAIGPWSGRCSETMTAYSFAPGTWGMLSLRGGFDDFREPPAGVDFTTLASARLNGFSYSTGPNGELSLTLTNHLDVASFGYFELSTDMTGTMAIPEPDVYLCMLLGLGVLGGFPRWRAKAWGSNDRRKRHPVAPLRLFANAPDLP